MGTINLDLPAVEIREIRINSVSTYSGDAETLIKKSHEEIGESTNFTKINTMIPMKMNSMKKTTKTMMNSTRKTMEMMRISTRMTSTRKKSSTKKKFV